MMASEDCFKNFFSYQVPIISEDIQRQRTSNEHQPPFSDAYLSGMPKKRRIEQQQKTGSSSQPK